MESVRHDELIVGLVLCDLVGDTGLGERDLTVEEPGCILFETDLAAPVCINILL